MGKTKLELQQEIKKLQRIIEEHTKQGHVLTYPQKPKPSLPYKTGGKLTLAKLDARICDLAVEVAELKMKADTPLNLVPGRRISGTEPEPPKQSSLTLRIDNMEFQQK
ncbi:MAG: hypothetical protein GY820_16895 [Gammaproteobacteria bacterium]|nr:hypothetical protein [Gammaproteobacteria bacterium]